MGMDISGGIIIGADGYELSVPDNLDEELELYKWAEDVGLNYFSPHYDCSDDVRVYGFNIKSIWKESELDEFIEAVRKKMQEFREITGVEPSLIGMQDVW